ncbi:sec-independent translocase chloroplastic-like [Raphidocelis subcapitata]|uniref:Sec-independent translocase chloroplastic-like n=1 Tax=Raphidocelis subcapitata TaxID=307507 RepID=A0A2V0PGS7_9CHLO|nr:sec-independent translocase chloroplastic-like [Raphidocelis subcapitata]|eukprot:GBF99031.1 sec-independent translocase chloroplastic-like [Raphidocelis subcapitata]
MAAAIQRGGCGLSLGRAGAQRQAPRAARPAAAVAPAQIRRLPGRAPFGGAAAAPFGGKQQLQQRTVLCRGLFGLGVPELVVIAGVAALIFGPSKLPELGKGLGKTVKSFQTAAKEFETELKAATADDADKPPKAEGEKKAE